MYYHPEHIPQEFRRTSQHNESVDPYGIYNIAPRAPHAKSTEGVLKAVEDFLRIEDSLELLRVEGMYGFGILVSRDLCERHSTLRPFLDQLSCPSVIQQHITMLEGMRIDAVSRYYKNKNTHCHSLRSNTPLCASNMRDFMLIMDGARNSAVRSRMTRVHWKKSSIQLTSSTLLFWNRIKVSSNNSRMRRQRILICISACCLCKQSTQS